MRRLLLPLGLALAGFLSAAPGASANLDVRASVANASDGRVELSVGYPASRRPIAISEPPTWLERELVVAPGDTRERITANRWRMVLGIQACDLGQTVFLTLDNPLIGTPDAVLRQGKNQRSISLDEGEDGTLAGDGIAVDVRRKRDSDDFKEFAVSVRC